MYFSNPFGMLVKKMLGYAALEEEIRLFVDS
jgi:hypothetical protein